MSSRRSVLIVEDDPNDAALLQAAFEELRLQHPIRVVENGGEAVEYLLGTGPYRDRAAHPFPALVILDLKLPVMNGFQVLGWLREHPELKAKLRLVAITSLVWPDTAQKVSELGAQELLEKPLGFEKLKELIRGVKERWLDSRRH